MLYLTAGFLSLSETVTKIRLCLLYEGARGLTFCEQFICSFKATLDPC